MADSAPSGSWDSSHHLPERLRFPEPPRNGWDRVLALYRLDEDGQYSIEVKFLVKSIWTGAFFGLVYGGVPAARYRREQFIKHSQAEIYQHRVEAVRASHNAAVRGFARYGVRWGWRVAAFVGIFNFVNINLMAYRDKLAVSNFAVAGAVTGGLFRLNLGLQGIIAGSFVGTLLGTTGGVVYAGAQTLLGLDMLEYIRNEREKIQERRLQKWKENLAATDSFVEQMEEVRQDSAEEEVKKIHELLQFQNSATPEQ